MPKNKTEKIPGDFRLNFFRSSKRGNNVLLTTDHGGWIVLSENEYFKLLKHQIDELPVDDLLSNGIILTGDNIDLIIENYRKRYELFYRGTSLHLVVSTTRCNQACIYCHSNAVKPTLIEETMDGETAEKVVDFIFQSPSPDIIIEFQGGESLLAFDCVEYVVTEALEKNKKMNKRLFFTIVSNISLLNDKMIEFIAKYNIKVTTSLDGPKFIHDKNRQMVGGGDTYDIVIEKMNKLKSKNINVGMLMVTTRYSLPYWKEIIDEYIKHGQLNIRLIYLDYLGVAKKTWDRIGYTLDEYLDFWKKSVDYIFSLNKKGVLMLESNVDLILKKMQISVDPNFLDLRSPCGIVTGQLAYNYNGDIYSCDEGRSDGYYILGNVKKYNYMSVLHSRKKDGDRPVSYLRIHFYVCLACPLKSR